MQELNELGLKSWHLFSGVVASVVGLVVMLWRASMAAVFKGTDIAIGEAKSLREENRLLRTERDIYRAQLIAAGIEPKAPR